MTQIFWRSKEGSLAPIGARFFLKPFARKLIQLSGTYLSSLPSPTPFLVPLKRIDRPNRKTWKEMVKNALFQIERGFLQKVVLARKTTFLLQNTPDPLQMVAALEEKTAGASLFCIQRKKTAFLGASPERLFRREGNQLFVDALAGTKKPGKDFSNKEIREFQFVKDYLLQSSLCEQMRFSPMRVHETANLQHLYAQGRGILRSHMSDLQIIKALHPTPALCGVPQVNSFDWIQTNEPFRRDLYGGLLGWSLQERADATICIRCCKIEKNQIHVYTGAGIVAGSDAEEEWEELEAKLSLYEEMIQCGHASIN